MKCPSSNKSCRRRFRIATRELSRTVTPQLNVESMYILRCLRNSLKVFQIVLLLALSCGSLAVAQSTESKSPATPPAEAKPPIVLGSSTIVAANVAYSDNAHPLQKLDIYAPKGCSNAPVYVFVHGGGWNKRDKDEVGAQPKLFNEAGMIVVSVNYRLVPEIQHPKNVQDLAESIAWIHKNVAKYGGDPKKIVLMGHSAGSHLVALVSTDDRYLAAHGLHRNQLAGVISLDGSAFDIPDRIKNGAATIVENCRKAFGESPEVQADGSPVNHVKHSIPLPPYLLVYLKEESLNHRQSQRFSELVNSAGGKASLIHITDEKTHQELCDDLGTQKDSTGPLLVDFVRQVVRDK